jgi:phosphatidylglycerophosphate synthase
MGSGVNSTVTPLGASTFASALSRLASAQKSSKGAPPYSRYVNRPLGRLLAAAAYQAGLTPNQVTYISAVFTFAGIAMIALAPSTWFVGGLVALALVVGYALDSADGQLARLQGSGTAAGEWLDHMIDSVKVASIHLAVLIALYRFFQLRNPLWLLVPVVFAIVSAVHFFGMVLFDMLQRIHRLQTHQDSPKNLPASTSRSLIKLPVDYGTVCLIFVLLGWHRIFLLGYLILAAATLLYTVLVARRWHRQVIDFTQAT